MADIIVCIVIVILIIIAVRSYIRQRKSGGCGGSCAECKRKCGFNDDK